MAIAGVIAMKPHVLILDEPTAGLDPGAHHDILEMIEEVHGAQNNNIIFVSHNMADVASLSDKVMVLDNGKLVMVGTPQEVFSQKAASGVDRTQCAACYKFDVSVKKQVVSPSTKTC